MPTEKPIGRQTGITISVVGLLLGAAVWQVSSAGTLKERMAVMETRQSHEFVTLKERIGKMEERQEREFGSVRRDIAELKGTIAVLVSQVSGKEAK